jgi:hypothetical protein
MGSGSWQRARIMITVKTYPERSAKYHETSCVAGIRLDQGTPQHVRLFPLPFRLLNEESQFAKYSIVEVDVQRHHGERRPESLRPNLQTLKVIERLGTADGWRERFSHVQPLVAPSLCSIKRDQELRGTSLGVFPPSEFTDFRLAPAEPWPASKPPWQISWIYSRRTFANWSGCHLSSGTASDARTRSAVVTTWG